MVTGRFTMIAVEGLEVNYFRWNRKTEVCREISRVKRKKKMEPIYYLMCLIIWKKIERSICSGTALLEAESRLNGRRGSKGINF